MTFDSPNISVGSKTNEQNMQVTKSYLSSMADNLNYLVARVESLESTVATLQSALSELSSS